MNQTPATPPSPTTPPPPPTPPPSPRWRGPNPWRLVVGLFVILIGVSLLGQQFGWRWIDPTFVWKLWPMFIILAGVSLLLRGRTAAAILGMCFVLLIVGGLAFVSVVNRQTDTHQQQISVDTPATATAGSVTLDIGAANLTVRGGATVFASGLYETSTENLQISSALNGTTQNVTLRRPSHMDWWMGPWKSTFNLAVTNALPLDLIVNTGASKLSLDLTGVQARSVDINAGASSVDLTLDDLVSKSSVSIDSGAASLTVRVPSAVGIHARLSGGAMRRNLPADLKKVADEVYETDGYGTAAKQLDLRVDAGASSISIQRL